MDRVGASSQKYMKTILDEGRNKDVFNDCKS